MGANTSRASTSLSYHLTLLYCLYIVLTLTLTTSVNAKVEPQDENNLIPSTFSLSSSFPSPSYQPHLKSRQLTSPSHPRIPITPGLPSTSSLPDSLYSTFDSILSSLSSTADSLTSRAIRSSHLSIDGLPGTSITSTEDFKSIQAYLDCTVGEGEWVYVSLGTSLSTEGKGLPVHKLESKYSSCDKRFYKGRDPASSTETEWDVRESLKYHFLPSSTCSSLLPSHLAPSKKLSQLPSRTRFCELLAHKSLLLLGSPTQYSLHDLLLDYTTIEPQSCYGDLYCKEHALCGGILGNQKGSEKERSVENWEIDERVYHRLPLPPPSSDLSPRSVDPNSPSLERRQSKSLYPSPTYSTLLRYRRTDGLRPATAQTLPSYQHPFTAISEKNQQWLADSRRSDLVILEKRPLPLPLKSHNATFDNWFYEYLENDKVEVEGKVKRILEAVEEVTREVWLVELMDALKSIRGEPSPLDQLVVYRSGWRSHFDCGQSQPSSNSPEDGPSPLNSQPTLHDLIYRPSTNSLQPLHIIYHNLQLTLQNHLARTEILPSFGIPYLDLETPLSVWRSGLLGGSGGGQKGMRSSTSGDCERYCFPSPGLAVERGFVGGLERLLELSWGGRREWEGDGFRNLRMRLEEREKGK